MLQMKIRRINCWETPLLTALQWGHSKGAKYSHCKLCLTVIRQTRFQAPLGEVAGFSLHAGVATKANERAKLERLCRYITRPAVSTKRLSLTRNGQVRYELKKVGALGAHLA